MPVINGGFFVLRRRVLSAPLGNQFWKARSTHGRDKLFTSPAALWESCCEYFQWVENNPLYEMRPFAYQGEVVQEPVAKMRAMTISGLCIFLDITRETWSKWRSDNDFSDTVKRVDEIIYEQKFTGAAADLLNPNIIARDLGLADKQEVKQTQDIKVTADMNPQDAAKAYQDLMNG